MLFLVSVVVCALVAHEADAIFANQAGKADWRRQFVGDIGFAQLDGKRVVVASHDGVVASLSAKHGAIQWRKELRHFEEIDEIIVNAGVLYTVSAEGKRVQSIEVKSGGLIWETQLAPLHVRTLPSYQIPTNIEEKKGNKWVDQIDIKEISVGSGDDLIVVLSDNEVFALNQADGHIVWQTQLPAISSDNNNDGSRNVRFHALSFFDSKLSVIGLAFTTKLEFVLINIDISNGELDDESIISIPSSFPRLHSCVSTGQNYFACNSASKSSSAIVLNLETQSVSEVHVPIEIHSQQQDDNNNNHPILHITSSKNKLLIISNKITNAYAVYQLTSNPPRLLLSKPKSDGETVFSDDEHDGNKYLIVVHNAISTQHLQVTVFDVENEKFLVNNEQSLAFPSHFGQLSWVSLDISSQSAKVSASFILKSSDGSIHFIEVDKIKWYREESLALIQSVQLADLPLKHQVPELAQDSNIISQFIQRMKNDFHAFADFINDLHSVDEVAESHHLVRDEFNQRHVIVVATKTNKIFGLDSSNGKTLWSSLVHVPQESKGTISLFSVRSSLRGHPVTVFISQGLHTYVYPFNSFTGEEIDEINLKTTTIQHPITLFSLHVNLDDFSNVIVVVDSKLSAHFIPSIKSLPSTLQQGKPTYFSVVKVDEGTVSGYRLISDGNNVSAMKLSQIIFDSSTEAIVAVSSNGVEPVSSLGEPLADRSVMLKYINPHLVAVATLTNYTRNAATLTVYVINTVRGIIVDQVSHAGVQGPINIVIAENWVVYHYYNKDERRFELSVSELYESDKTSPILSALTQAAPSVDRRSYIFSSAVLAMGVTRTLASISNRNLLLALPSGTLLSLPKKLVDARRPIDNRGALEGVLPYRPILPVAQQMGLNYNQSLSRPRSISSFPSGLESTSLVFVSGLDIFFTPAAPSRQFDVLSDDFNFIGLVLSLIALAATSYVLSQLAANKALKAAWV